MARFFHGYPWRWAVLKIASPSTTPVITVRTFLDHWAIDGSVNIALNAPTAITLRVPSDEPEVRLADGGDGDPFADEGNRAIIGFRREGITGTSEQRWFPRAAGIIMQPTDQADVAQGAGNAYTTLNAMDAWQLMYRRLVRTEDGELPSADGGLTLLRSNGAEIITDLLAYSEAADGPSFIDAGFGTVEDTGPAEMTFTRGQSIGEAFDEWCVSYGDIVLEPIWEPTLSPECLWALNIYEQAGQSRPSAIFAYDLPSRSLGVIRRAVDGTQRVNREQAYYGEGGIPAAVQFDSPSVIRNGRYMISAVYPAAKNADTATAAAAEDVRVRKDGVTTITVDPSPERSPIALTEYEIGDEVPVYASARKFRKRLDGEWRVTRIPITIRGRTEYITGLELTAPGVVVT